MNTPSTAQANLATNNLASSYQLLSVITNERNERRRKGNEEQKSKKKRKKCEKLERDEGETRMEKREKMKRRGGTKVTKHQVARSNQHVLPFAMGVRAGCVFNSARVVPATEPGPSVRAHLQATVHYAMAIGGNRFA